jgi:hypothetical protein
MAASIEQCVVRSDELYKALASRLTTVETDGTSRANLTLSMCTIAFEHGISSRVVLSLENLTSAIALLRLQYEVVVRAIWLHYAASEDWVSKVADLVSAGSLKEPANAPTVSDMLEGIEKTAPPEVGRMLRGLKEGAWGPLNSYVHGGIHPLMQLHRGYPPEYAVQTLLNANGLTTMAAMLTAMLSGDPKLTAEIKRVQLDHLDCLPPLVR